MTEKRLSALRATLVVGARGSVGEISVQSVASAQIRGQGLAFSVAVQSRDSRSEILAIGADDQVEQPLEIFGGVEADFEGTLGWAGEFDLYIRLKDATKLVLDLAGGGRIAAGWTVW